MNYYDDFTQREIQTFKAWTSYVAEPKKELCPDCGRELIRAPARLVCTGGHDGCYYRKGE